MRKIKALSLISFAGVLTTAAPIFVTSCSEEKEAKYSVDCWSQWWVAADSDENYNPCSVWKNNKDVVNDVDWFIIDDGGLNEGGKTRLNIINFANGRSYIMLDLKDVPSTWEGTRITIRAYKEGVFTLDKTIKIFLSSNNYSIKEVDGKATDFKIQWNGSAKESVYYFEVVSGTGQLIEPEPNVIWHPIVTSEDLADGVITMKEAIIGGVAVCQLTINWDPQLTNDGLVLISADAGYHPGEKEETVYQEITVLKSST